MQTCLEIHHMESQQSDLNKEDTTGSNPLPFACGDGKMEG